MTATTRNRIAELAAEYRTDYAAEFGAAPDAGTIGDWDSAAWEEASKILRREGVEADEDGEDWTLFRALLLGETAE